MKKMGAWTVGIFILIAVVMNCFFGLLIYSDFRSNYEKAQMQYYDLIGEQFASDLTQGILYGKTLARYYGVERVFSQMQAYIPEDIPICIVDSEWNMLFAAQDDNALLQVFQQSKWAALPRSGSENEYGQPLAIGGGAEAIIWPIQDESGGHAGALMIFAHDNQYTGVMRGNLLSIMRLSLLVSAAAALLLLLGYWLLLRPGRAYRAPIRRRMGVLTAIVVCSLFVQGMIAYGNAQTQYRVIMEESGRNVCNYLVNVVEDVNRKGVPYDEMQGLDAFFEQKVEQIPLLANVSIEKRDLADLRSVVALQLDGQRLFMYFTLSAEYINNATRQVFLAFLLTMIIAIVIMLEVGRLPQIVLDRARISDAPAREEAARRGAELQARGITSMLRLGAFLIYIGNYMCIPFTAAVLRETNASVFGLSTSITASLPATLEAFGMMLGLLAVNRLGARLKTKNVLRAAVLTLVICNLLCSIATSVAGTLLLLRWLCGMGSALISHSLQRIATHADTGDVRANLAAINAGLLGGITCGGSLGAIVSGVIGTRATFLGGAFFAIMFFLVVTQLAGKAYLNALGEERKKGSGFLHLCGDRSIVLYILCAIIPLNVGIMFMVSFFPVFMDSVGYSSLAASYGYLLNGLAGIYIGSLLVDRLGKRLGVRKSLAVLMGVAAAAMLLLALPGRSLVWVMLAAAIMGIFDEFGGPVVSQGFLKLSGDAGVPPLNALAYSSIIGNITQMACPMLYGLLVMQMGDAQGGVSALLAIVLGAAVAAAVSMLGLRKLDREPIMAAGG